MKRLERVKKLAKKGKYREAARILDEILHGNEDDSLYYLRAILALRLDDYRKAEEFLERAIFVKKKPTYVRMKGMLFFELLDFEMAALNFEECISLKPKDFLSNFFLSMSYMFLDNPKSTKYLKKAYAIDRKKTKRLLRSFYDSFFAPDTSIDKATKKMIEDRLGRIR